MLLAFLLFFLFAAVGISRLGIFEEGMRMRLESKQAEHGLRKRHPVRSGILLLLLPTGRIIVLRRVILSVYRRRRTLFTQGGTFEHAAAVMIDVGNPVKMAGIVLPQHGIDTLYFEITYESLLRRSGSQGFRNSLSEFLRRRVSLHSALMHADLALQSRQPGTLADAAGLDTQTDPVTFFVRSCVNQPGVIPARSLTADLFEGNAIQSQHGLEFPERQKTVLLQNAFYDACNLPLQIGGFVVDRRERLTVGVILFLGRMQAILAF